MTDPSGIGPTPTTPIEIGFDIHDTEWWLGQTRGEFLPVREVEDDGELGVFYAPVPVETVQLSRPDDMEFDQS